VLTWVRRGPLFSVSARLACLSGGRFGGAVPEGGPFLLALGQRFPGQEVEELLVALADGGGPDAEAVPDAERDRGAAVERAGT
jgi:hypothetical protein